MKKLSTVSLFIFGIVVTAILTAGLVFYQNNKRGTANELGTSSVVKDTIDKINPSGGTLTLNMTEIKKHNKSTDCWMLISGNVYNITSFFGSHPGGNSVMEATCGTDATDAYMTKDPNATSTTGGQDHSSSARDMLKDYYLGALNQTLSLTGQNTKTNNIVSISTKSTTTNNTVKATTVKNPSIIPASSITLTLSEISKHNKQTDCFLLISGKVYNITSFFGSHPGGNATMAATCGTDATAAYMTKDPNATSSGTRSAHSSGAKGMLDAYFIGNLNQSIGTQAIKTTNAVTAPVTSRGDDEWDD